MIFTLFFFDFILKFTSKYINKKHRKNVRVSSQITQISRIFMDKKKDVSQRYTKKDGETRRNIIFPLPYRRGIKGEV
jgi:hypothetical protein